MMLNAQNLLLKKGKYRLALLLIVSIAATCIVSYIVDNDDFALSRREVLLRKIGHELLLQSGDSTSKVLPVKKVADTEYQIRFEKEFTFRAASLIATTKRLLDDDPLANDYIVSVLNGDKMDIAYSYAVSKNKNDNIVTCIGRKQPSSHYLISIKFKQSGIDTIKNRYLLSGLPILAFIGFILYSPSKVKKELTEERQADMFTLGTTLFDVKSRKLIINKNITELTGTETRLLQIFALSPNETIERSRLQKEIWEDEGVIVGRSLDMFISKLRKKLDSDPKLKIIVVRGRGYKLQTN